MSREARKETAFALVPEPARPPRRQRMSMRQRKEYMLVQRQELSTRRGRPWTLVGRSHVCSAATSELVATQARMLWVRL